MHYPISILIFSDQEIAKRYSMLPASQEFPYHQNKGDYDTTPNLQNFAGKVQFFYVIAYFTVKFRIH